VAAAVAAAVAIAATGVGALVEVGSLAFVGLAGTAIEASLATASTVTTIVGIGASTAFAGASFAKTHDPADFIAPLAAIEGVMATRGGGGGGGAGPSGEGTSMDLPASETWGRPSTLADHFARHGADFGASSEEVYAQEASDFFQRGLRDELPTKIDPKTGTIRIYDSDTNTFGAYNPNGTTRTFYKPDPMTHGYPTNGDYWHAQPGHSPWGP
jgi:hypothetical protein